MQLSLSVTTPPTTTTTITSSSSLLQVLRPVDGGKVVVMANSPADNTNSTTSNNVEDDEEPPEGWEDWDATKYPFWIHCVAGSMAGVVEHGAMYPVDTIRTHIQAAASTAVSSKSNKIPIGIWQTIQYLVNSTAPTTVETAAATGGTITSTTTTAGISPPPAASTGASSSFGSTSSGYLRLWRGCQTVLWGCAPSHAMYFALYESVKHTSISKNENHILTAWGSSAAGAAATIGHDIVMTPMDTIKQRLQLGYYNGSIATAYRTILHNEGFTALYRSLPVTLVTKVPYHMIMVTTNEQCKQYIMSTKPLGAPLDVSTVLISGSVAGFVAAAGTTPLDRIKTAIQIQSLVPFNAAGSSSNPSNPPTNNKVIKVVSAITKIYTTEGLSGFVRGLIPRVISHTPACALSWTAYEIFKQSLINMSQ